VLGDTVLGAGENSYNVFCTLLNVLKYHTLYIAGGNHTAAIRRIFNDNLKAGGAVDEFYRLKVREFQRDVYIIPNYYEIFIGGQHVVLSHYPILSFNGMGRDSIHLHGHSHSSLKKNQWINDNYLTAKVLDVGLENTMLAPLPYLEIEKIMEIKEDKTFDHHGK
jgi:calcineurin-like phosphoesterase family protein